MIAAIVTMYITTIFRVWKIMASMKKEETIENVYYRNLLYVYKNYEQENKQIYIDVYKVTAVLMIKSQVLCGGGVRYVRIYEHKKNIQFRRRLYKKTNLKKNNKYISKYKDEVRHL